MTGLCTDLEVSVLFYVRINEGIVLKCHWSYALNVCYWKLNLSQFLIWCQFLTKSAVFDIPDPQRKCLLDVKKRVDLIFFGIVSNTAPKLPTKSEKKFKIGPLFFVWHPYNVTPDFEGFGFLILMISASIFHLK